MPDPPLLRLPVPEITPAKTAELVLEIVRVPLLLMLLPDAPVSEPIVWPGMVRDAVPDIMTELPLAPNALT